MGKLRVREPGQGSGLLLCRGRGQPGAGTGAQSASGACGQLRPGGPGPGAGSVLQPPASDLKLHPAWPDRPGLRPARRALGVAVGQASWTRCVPGTEVPPSLSLGSVLCSQPPREGWGRKWGVSGVSHLECLFWGGWTSRWARRPAPAPVPVTVEGWWEPPGSWVGEGTAPQALTRRRRGQQGAPPAWSTWMGNSGAGPTRVVFLIVCTSYHNEKIE